MAKNFEVIFKTHFRSKKKSITHVLLWVYRSSKPNIDFLEIPTLMGESLCHLVRIDVNHFVTRHTYSLYHYSGYYFGRKMDFYYRITTVVAFQNKSWLHIARTSVFCGVMSEHALKCFITLCTIWGHYSMYYMGANSSPSGRSIQRIAQ